MRFVVHILCLFIIGLVIGMALTGCSSFKLGGVAYCPYGQNCSFQQVAPSGGSSSDGPASQSDQKKLGV